MGCGADGKSNKISNTQKQVATIPNEGDSIEFMKIINTIAIAGLAISLTSCATAPAPQVFHNADSTALVIRSLDSTTCQIIQPTLSKKEKIDDALASAMALPAHKEAVVILENYNESSFGPEFRDRGTIWFVGLRNVGYEHIVFLKGQGADNPDGLVTLVQYE